MSFLPPDTCKTLLFLFIPFSFPVLSFPCPSQLHLSSHNRSILTLPHAPQVNVPVDKGTRSVLQRTLVATAFSMAPRSQVSHGDRHYIAEYSCCPPPLLIPLLCTAEVRTVVAVLGVLDSLYVLLFILNFGTKYLVCKLSQGV